MTAWRYEGSVVPVPWRALGDFLFEMGACACSVSVEKEERQQGTAVGGEASAREAAVAASAAAAAEATEEGQDNREAMLTLIVAEGGGWGRVSAALETACELAGGPDGCFGKADDR